MKEEWGNWMRGKKHFKISKSVWVYIIIAAVTVLLNLIAWKSTTFCDWYITYVFQIWVNTYGRLMGIFPFSVGELMLAAAVILVAVALILWIPMCLWKSIRRYGRKYYSFFVWILLGVCVIMTLNCSILYHASTFSENYFKESKEEKYSLEELVAVRNLVVEECERLALLMEREADGTILYDQDMKAQAILDMQELGKKYERLQGFYPHPKPLVSSDFFSQQYMCGYYFPFSLEANYNDVMYLMNKPSTMCHELAHLRGYIFEDEANFISFLACTQSEDLVFQYSGYLSVLYYLDNDFYDAVGRNWELYAAQPAISAQVHQDNIFLMDEEWDRINGKALIDTEIVDEISDVVVDTTLKVNGVSDGMISYNRVVELLLHYYKLQGKI